jgi:hypothetical protein
MRARLATLAALGACWPAWLAGAWLAEALWPGGPVLLLQALLLIALLGPIGLLLDRLDPTPENDHHG